MPIVEAQLSGTDPEGNAISYVLDAPRSGEGYELAFVDPDSGMANVVLSGAAAETLVLNYRVTDGVQFSEPADLNITVGVLDDGELGARTATPEDYGALDIVYFGSGPSGESEQPLPDSIDLSNNFPPAGDQGEQGSCVGWAFGYALKSYQEKVEEGWEYSSDSALFSPAWIYNQINGGVDRGARPIDALQLIVDSGAATVATAPYDPADHTSPPGAEARAEAEFYKARSFGRIGNVLDAKRALAARVPIVIGIEAFDSLSALQGSDAVYNDFTGPSRGGHAVTIAGYDDNLHGGAFKVINSWGRDWGDDGYFWLPYRHVSQIVLEAYVLEDAANSGVYEPPPVPPVDETLPDLVVSDWSASYESRAGGNGTLEWRVTNEGNSAAAAGADVNLVLSLDRQMDPTDIIVRYEELDRSLPPGGTLFRDENNALSFSFPLDLPAGEYFMAVWVDDLDEVAESDETNNIAFGENTVSIAETQLPDLVVEQWWASWDPVTGAGELEYSVRNEGNADVSNTEWDINLVLSTGTDVAETLAHYLFFEDGNFALSPGQAVFRDGGSRARFNIFRSQSGNRVTPGTYYLSMWVDDLDQVEESREYNNLSTDNSPIGIDVGQKATGLASAAVQHRFNGRVVPDNAQILAKVVIDEGGAVRDAALDGSTHAAREEVGLFHDTSRAAYPSIFPATDAIAMPAADSDARPKASR